MLLSAPHRARSWLACDRPREQPAGCGLIYPGHTGIDRSSGRDCQRASSSATLLVIREMKAPGHLDAIDLTQVSAESSRPKARCGHLAGSVMTSHWERVSWTSASRSRTSAALCQNALARVLRPSTRRIRDSLARQRRRAAGSRAGLTRPLSAGLRMRPGATIWSMRSSEGFGWFSCRGCAARNLHRLSFGMIDEGRFVARRGRAGRQLVRRWLPSSPAS